MTMQAVRHRHPAARAARGIPPRGAAALVVVMVLFFIVALAVAYTSRGLIFDQRASANQYRSTQAFEAAEAGLEWALTMLNSGRIDAACTPRTDPATTYTSFRRRYLTIPETADPIVPRTRSDGQPLRPACVFDGSNWQCSCPVDGAPALSEPTAPGPHPAFVLRFYANNPTYPPGSPTLPYPPGVVRIEATGCTRFDAADVCAADAASGDGRATVTILAALKSALPAPPPAAVTVRASLTGADQLLVANGDRASGGYTLHVGGAITGAPTLFGPAGTPSDGTVISPDPAMAPPALSPDQMFISRLGIGRGTYRLQPAAVSVKCSVDCSASTVRDMALLNPGRVLWVDGDFVLDVADPIGSAASPVMLVVTGNMDVNVAGARVNGVVYAARSGGTTLSNSGTLVLGGALFAEDALTLSGAGTTSVAYDAEVLNRLRWTTGSFVRVPGSWRDF